MASSEPTSDPSLKEYPASEWHPGKMDIQGMINATQGDETKASAGCLYDCGIKFITLFF